MDVLTVSGQVKGQTELPDRVFGRKGKTGPVWESVRCYLANQRQGTACTKTRSEVSGTGKKPHRQKHTGRARHGSKRSPLHVGGGIAWGPRPRDYSRGLPRKLRRQALVLALTARKDENALLVVEDFDLPEPKTREMVGVLSSLNLAGSILLVVDKLTLNLKRASRNLPELTVMSAHQVSTYDVVGHQRVVFTESGLKRLVAVTGAS